MSALVILTAGAAVESAVTGGTTGGLILRGVTTSPATLWDVTCPRANSCIAVGERGLGNRNQAIFIEQRNGVWSGQIPLGPSVTTGYGGLASIACSGVNSCMTSEPETGSLSLISPFDGRPFGGHAVFPPISVQVDLGQTACSPGGFCWTLVSRSIPPSKHRAARIWDYVVGEHDGHWLAPYPVGGPHLRIGGERPTLLLSRDLSCWSPTSCTVAAFAGSGTKVATIVQTEVNGSWGSTTVVPGSVYSPGSTSTAPYFRISVLPAGPGLACSSSGMCVLGGEVTTNSTNLQTGAIVQEVDGRWLPPITGIGVAAPYLHSVVTSVACHDSALCVAEGISGLPNGDEIPFVQAEVHGRWQAPVLMADLGRTAVGLWMNGSGCPTASTCDVFGSLSGGSGWNPAYVATYVDGTWRYSLLTIHGSTLDLQVTGMSCGWKTCWIAASDSSSGFVLPFPTFK